MPTITKFLQISPVQLTNYTASRKRFESREFVIKLIESDSDSNNRSEVLEIVEWTTIKHNYKYEIGWVCFPGVRH